MLVEVVRKVQVGNRTKMISEIINTAPPKIISRAGNIVFSGEMPDRRNRWWDRGKPHNSKRITLRTHRVGR